ncbi:MAG: PIN domain-containing protein [Saprospiraceae bacterium]|nr:PIN domain-containing protein [Candidatus Defluviibacterium haderslevense]MBK7245091.1 PIN domain-containing protein [Candidatus Defluviibacterium haderslevense]
MSKFFIDTDVCLDLLANRMPYSNAAQLLFSQADKGTIQLHVSALTFANLDYILKSTFKIRDGRIILSKFKTLVKVLPVTSKVIELALTSDFVDFEDAIQYYTCIQARISTLLTRNLKDFKKAKVNIMTPDMYLKT